MNGELRCHGLCPTPEVAAEFAQMQQGECRGPVDATTPKVLILFEGRVMPFGSTTERVCYRRLHPLLRVVIDAAYEVNRRTPDDPVPPEGTI
jgi:hypothetical protein